MGPPVFERKHNSSSLFSAEDVLRSRAEAGFAVDELPPTVLLTWQDWLFDEMRDSSGVRDIAIRLGRAVQVSATVALALLPPGAPIVAMAIEEFAVQGMATAVGVGTAGGIMSDLASGDVVLSSAALRDEGTSHHYAPATRLAYPDPTLVRRVSDVLHPPTVGPTWTTDAPYRETLLEVEHHQASGLITVDMESAALLTVARYRHVAAASVFCITDVLCDGTWRSGNHPRVREQLRSLISQLAVALA